MSYMRLLSAIVTIVGVILAIYVVIIWSFTSFTTGESNSLWSKSIDISQQTTLILGMIGIALAGKTFQKFAERGVNKKNVSINTELNKDENN